MFLLFVLMLSGALGQQDWLLQPQREQLQKSSVFMPIPQKLPTSAELQTRSSYQNFQNFVASVPGPQKAKQSSQSVSHMNNLQALRHENEVRHRDLPIASAVYPKVANKTRSSGTSKSVHIANSTITSNRQQYITSTFKHPLFRRRFVLPYGLDQLSDIQPIRQSQTLKSSQVPVLAIGTPRLNVSVLQFVPRRSVNISIHDKTIPEPVLAFQTTLQPVHRSLNRRIQFPMPKEGIGESPNDAFLKCCKERNVDSECESRCNFDVLDRKVLTAMFVGSDPCPRSNGRRLLSCAAQDSDQTNCCRANGVQQTAAGDKCVGFCQMTPESKFQVNVSMLPCWSVLNEIKRCFRLSFIEKYNI